jgi:hypothetical protein
MLDFQRKEDKSMSKRVAALLCCAALLGALPLFADEWNKKTTVTFSAPIEVPGMALPAGTYVFKLADSQSDRHIVQVFNADETRLFTTILAIPNYRLTPTGETVLRFEERPSNTPEAIRAWFYPGDNFGQEFVYPKTKAVEIAAKANVPVLSTEAPPAAKSEDFVKAPVTTVMPETPKFAAAPETPARVAEAPQAMAPPVMAALMPAAPAKELPKTASSIPLLAVMGVFSLAIAGVLFGVVKHLR